MKAGERKCSNSEEDEAAAAIVDENFLKKDRREKELLFFFNDHQKERKQIDGHQNEINSLIGEPEKRFSSKLAETLFFRIQEQVSS